MNAGAALPEPAVGARPVPAPEAVGIARLKSAIDHRYWSALEYLESAGQRRVSGLVLAGEEKHSGAPLRLLYLGSGNHLAYVRALVFRNWRVEEEQTGLGAWNAQRWISERESSVSLVIADLPWPWHHLLRGRGLVEVPAWVNQRMTLPQQWQEVIPQLRRSARGEDMRSIRKRRFEYRLVRDEEAVRQFYEQMYVPHLTRRFGEAAYIEPEWKIRYCVDSGTLMEIRRDGQLVAAQVLWGSRGSLHFLWTGTIGEEYGAQTRGIFPALYYFGILYAFENGFDEVDYCGSRPMLADGIFQMKRRWGARVLDGWSRDTLFIRPRDFAGANLEFLVRNPLIARSDHGLVGKVFCSGETAREDDVTRAAQHYASGGIRAIRLYSVKQPAPEAIATARAVPGVEIVDLSREADPVAAYCKA